MDNSFYVDSIEVTVYFDQFDNSWAFVLEEDDDPLGGSYGYQTEDEAAVQGREHAIEWIANRKHNTYEPT